MIYTQDREQLRRFWCNAWLKAKTGKALEPLEQVIVQIVAEHPEYHAILENLEKNNNRDWLPSNSETNPFLHLSMHLALRESLSVNRPVGINEIYYALMKINQNHHHNEHRMIECLAEMLWQAQRHNALPNENNFLTCLKKLLQK